jgi:hypothetical protein
MKRREDMTALESTLTPDFSEHVKDGKFDARGALESHINNAKIFLSAAMALLEDQPKANGALSLLELFEVALSRGINEAYRVKDPRKAA